MTHTEICGEGTLQDIFCQNGTMSDVVVRWCYRCGAVVVDEDVDGRIAPGGICQMLSPETSRMSFVRQGRNIPKD